MDNEKKDEKKVIDLRIAKIQVLYIPYLFSFFFLYDAHSILYSIMERQSRSFFSH
jgi:hypothetical protein